MKISKIILFMMSICLISVRGYGLTICAKTNTYVGMVRKTPAGIASEYNNTTKTWKVEYDYTVPTKAHPEGENRIVTGLAACNEIEGTENTPKTNLYTTSVDAGKQCWCKMEPVVAYGYETGLTSYWVFLKTFDDAVTCADYCTQACTSAMKGDYTFRSAVYESIW